MRNLTQIFGNPFGAQLLDLYVHNPAATTIIDGRRVPAAELHDRPADAWSERLEAQGFAALVWQNASGTALRARQFVVDNASGTATLVLPESVFGTVGSGWTFAVALTGQNGFNSYQARDFVQFPAATGNARRLRRLSDRGDTAPICSYRPGMVPKVMSTIRAVRRSSQEHAARGTRPGRNPGGLCCRA